MKKILMTLMLLIPALFANAQGPIKLWNDQLDDFVEVFNKETPALEQIYESNGVDGFIFTFLDPESGNVVMENSIADTDAFNKVNDDLMGQAKKATVTYLGSSTNKNSRLNSIVNEFDKRKTNVVLRYSNNGNKKEITITPAEIKAAK